MVKYIDYIISIEYSYDMNIRTLEYILAVYETGHFAKAAEKCNVSQPSLSIQIKKFEEQYGIKLFERDNKNFHTTRHGETLIQKISGIVSQFHDMEKTALRLANPDSGDLYIGAFPTLAPFYIPKVMPHIVKALPKFKFYLIEERSPRLIEQLQNGELDAALLALPLEEKQNFHVQTLFQEDLLAAVPANHTLAQRKNIALADLRGIFTKTLPILILSPSSTIKWAPTGRLYERMVSPLLSVI